MLISRGIPILKTLCRTNARTNAPMSVARFHSVKAIYREKGSPTRYEYWVSEIFAGIAWWWVAWCVYYEWEYLHVGHMPGPRPCIFSDEELGIPPDDED